MANNPVGWFEIYVQDMARAKRFYEAVFKLKLQQLIPAASGICGLFQWRWIVMVRQAH
jgi:predicted enzyme related to lactoylglutathione lyase